MHSSNDPTSRLTKHLDLQAERLRLDLEAARLFVGSSDIGTIAESAVRRFLSSNLPSRYAVGVGEVIAPDGVSPPRLEQSQQKDVLIYDAHGCAVLNWDDNAVSLFPVESIYGILEVKTSIAKTVDLLKAVDQALEAKKLVRSHRNPERKSPFTGVFAFESKVSGDAMLDALDARAPTERPDFVFVLNPTRSDVVEEQSSLYIVHWHYHSRNQGPITFVTADETAEERAKDQQKKDKFITLCVTSRALLWFYLFLTEELDSMQLTKPNLWQYASADSERLGYRRNAN